MKKSFILYLILTFLSIQSSIAQDFDNIIKSTADSLANKIIRSERKTVAIADFINLDNSVTQLGSFLNEEISSELSNLTDNQTKFRVLERTKLDQILKEKKLLQTVDGSEIAKELGKLDAANILIFATITDFNGYYRVVMKLLDTKTGDALSSCKVSFVKTPSLETLNAKIITKTSSTQANTENTVTIESVYKSSNTTPVSRRELDTTSTIKFNEEEKTGDICFTNQRNYDHSAVDLKIDIYSTTSNTRIKTINISSGQTSCAYNMLKGIYRLELTWLNGYRPKSETKEIRILVGKNETIPYMFD